MWQAGAFNPFPNCLDAGTGGELRHIGEEFVGVESERFSAEDGGEGACGEGVGIVGEEMVGGTEKEIEEKPQVVFGIEECGAVEEKTHAPGGIGPRGEPWAVGQPTPDQCDLPTDVSEGTAGAVNALVGGQIVGNGYDDAAHEGFLFSGFLLLLDNAGGG